MPFCTHCGTAVGDQAAFCQNCGKPQPMTAVPPPAAAGDPLNGMSGDMASTLCYIPWMGWVVSLVVLSTNRFRADGVVRFHAFQGMYLAVAWLIVDIALEPAMRISGISRSVEPLLKLGIVGTWIFMMIKTNAKQLVRLPVIGEMAERSVNEQGNSWKA
jgi:uncharacterized membrane protein